MGGQRAGVDCLLRRLFLGLMRMSSGSKPVLRYLVMGAVAGTLLLEGGKCLMAIYLSTAAIVSA